MMQTRSALVVAAIAASFAFTACGGDDEDNSDQPSRGAETTETKGAGGGAAADTFSTTCGGCHTLEAAGTNGNVGPNLDDLGPDRGRVLNAIQSGPGAMPEGLLAGAEAEAVADYVAANAGK